MSRLTIDMTSQQHPHLKALAAWRGKTIKRYTLEHLFPGDAGEDQAWQQLKSLLTRALMRDWRGRCPPKVFTTSSMRN